MIATILGLHLVLNSMQDEYVDWLAVAGVKVIIHDPNETVFPDTNGYSLTPQLESSFSFQKVDSIFIIISFLL